MNPPLQPPATTIPDRNGGGSGRRLAWLAGSVAVLLLGMFVGLRIGGGDFRIASGEILRWLLGGDIDPQHELVLRALRLPRVIMAVIAGGVLASAGAVYQALLRNPLAEPYTLGVAGGATVGAALAITLAGAFGWASMFQGLPLLAAAALMGAAFATTLIFLIARSAGRFSPSTIVLAGVTMNLIFGSFLLLLQYIADYTQIYDMIRWMMGGLDVSSRDYWVIGPIALAGWVVVFASLRELDLIAVDPVSAATLGVRVEPVRWRLLLTVSLMTGCVVAYAGPIGFVGLIVPHSVRMAIGASHRRLLPVSIVAGGLFLLACDTLAQNLLANQEVPVGIITSMLGGPFFVYLLLRKRGGAEGWGD
jgi:iron complex transport system permease protein